MPDVADPDSLLLNAIAKGNDQALAELYQRQAPAFLRYLSGRVQEARQVRYQPGAGA